MQYRWVPPVPYREILNFKVRLEEVFVGNDCNIHNTSEMIAHEKVMEENMSSKWNRTNLKEPYSMFWFRRSLK